MKKINLLFILVSLTACTSYNHRPVQDQVVGGTSLLDALTGRDRVGVITKQAHYDIFISRPVPSTKWYSSIPILNMFDKPSGYEICQAPPADAMASTASALAAAIKVEGSTKGNTVSGKVAGSLATSFANQIKAFSIRTQGLQYLRDVRFDNCIAWQNRGELEPSEKLKLRLAIIEHNKSADIIGAKLILKELELRASTNNFGVSGVGVSKEKIAEMILSLKKESGETVGTLMDEITSEVEAAADAAATEAKAEASEEEAAKKAK